MLAGIDVSYWNGYIDWRAVRGAGKAWAAAKGTEGLWFRDPTLAHNWPGMKQHGIGRIAYHFLRPNVDGAKQADYLHAYVREMGHFEYGDAVGLDLEEEDGMSPAQILRCAEAFVQRAWKMIDKPVILYVGPYFWRGILGDPHSPILAQCPLWLADWEPHTTPLANWPHGTSFWQYDAHGWVPGVPNEVDLDRFLGDGRQLRRILTVMPHH